MEKCPGCGSQLDMGQAFCPVCFTVLVEKSRRQNRPRLLLFWKELMIGCAVLTAAAVLTPLFTRTLPNIQTPTIYVPEPSESSGAAENVFPSSASTVSETTAPPPRSTSMPSETTITPPPPISMPDETAPSVQLPVSKEELLDSLADSLGSGFRQTGENNIPYLCRDVYSFSKGASAEEIVQKIARDLRNLQKGMWWTEVRILYCLELQELEREIHIDLYYGTPPNSQDRILPEGEAIAQAVRTRLEPEFQYVTSNEKSGWGLLWTEAGYTTEQAADELSRKLAYSLRANRYTSYAFWYCGSCLRGTELTHVFYYTIPRPEE